MNIGFRGRVFFVAVFIIVIISAGGAFYLEHELRTWLVERIEDEATQQAKAYRARIEMEATATTVEEFDAIIDTLTEPGSQRVTLIRSDGLVLGDSNLSLDRLRDIENHSERPEVKNATVGSAGTDRRLSKTLGVDMLYVAIPFKTPAVEGVLRVATPLALVDQAINKMRILLAFACLLGLIIAILVSSVASYLLSRRLRNLIERARSMAEGQLDTKTYSTDSSKEISILHKSLHRLDDALEEIVQTLANERDRFSAVLEGMQEAVLAVDHDGIVTMVNQGANKFLAFDQSPHGKHIRDVIDSRELRRSIKRALRGEAEEFDIDLQAQEGVRYVMGQVVPFSQEGGCIVVIHDVTRLRRLERVRRDFVANVSHELRTPVSVIRLNAEMLKEGALTDPDAGPQFVEALYRNSERLSELISDLLDVSRLESGQFEIEPDLIKVIEVGQVAYDTVQQLAAERGTTVTMRIPSELEVTADRSALEHVLINLVQNAVCYTPEGGNVELEAKSIDDNVRIEVRDDGPGIRPKYRKRIFERFYRVDKGRSKHMGGTGLGLSIVKHLVRIMDGEVGVTDNAPEGALFWVLLPGLTGEEILAPTELTE